MYPDTLENYEHYRFTHEDVFYSDYHLSKVRVHKNQNMEMHVHDFHEIAIMTSGSCMHYINGSKCLVKKGDVFIITPNTPHGYYSDDPFELYTINISERFKSKYFTDFQSKTSFYTLFYAEPLMRGVSPYPLYLSLNVRQNMEILSLLDIASRYAHPKSHFESMIANNLSIALLAILCKFYDENLAGDDDVPSDTVLLSTISIMHERYYEKFTLDQLAHMAHLSRSSFIKRFNEICKMPPLEYISKIRLEAAEDMLTNTSMPIFQIAEQTGFYDSAHLSKAFMAKNGISPGQYRKQKNKKEA